MSDHNGKRIETRPVGAYGDNLRSKHGHAAGSKSPEYNAWSNMRQRCQRPDHQAYCYYGGRGIKVCERWDGPDGFANFIADMGSRPTPEHSLDRVNNDGDYEPENCRWATKLEQSNNTRTCRLIEHNGEVRTIADWGRVLGIPAHVIRTRLFDGWPEEQALEPVRGRAGERQICAGKRNDGQPCRCSSVYPNGFCQQHQKQAEVQTQDIVVEPVGAYGLFLSATANGRFLAGGFSADEAQRRARRVLEAGGPPNHAHGDPLRRHLPCSPVVEVLDLGRGVLIHADRLPALAHRLPDVARCAEAARRWFVSAWVRHLAESSYSHGANERIAAELARILSETRATEWLFWRRNDALDGLRCPLTDVWFREQVRTDCCGIVIALDAAVVTEQDAVFCPKCWERRP